MNEASRRTRTLRLRPHSTYARVKRIPSEWRCLKTNEYYRLNNHPLSDTINCRHENTESPLTSPKIVRDRDRLTPSHEESSFTDLHIQLDARLCVKLRNILSHRGWTIWLWTRSVGSADDGTTNCGSRYVDMITTPKGMYRLRKNSIFMKDNLDGHRRRFCIDEI